MLLDADNRKEILEPEAPITHTPKSSAQSEWGFRGGDFNLVFK
jgi:hypothetical protein